jgi:hypothetical protein
MSMRQVLDTVDALLKDDALGLTATTIAFADGHPEIVGMPGPLRADYNFVKWALPGQSMRPTQYAGNVMLAPVDAGDENNGPGGTISENVAIIEVGFETFGASTDDVQNQLMLTYVALRQMLFGTPQRMGLIEYAQQMVSGVRRGTIYEIANPVRFRFAQYESATSGGWLASITILERSTE